MPIMKGPAVFLAQFQQDTPPYNTLKGLANWAAGHGYIGLQVPTNEPCLFDLEKAATSQAYCNEIQSICADAGVVITELSTHIQGQLMAVNPAYDILFDSFAPEHVKGNPKARQKWAQDQLLMAAEASKNLGLNAHATFSGALMWQNAYPWPQYPDGLVDTAFAELARVWLPVLDRFDECGVDLCYEIHPSEDLHDGVSFERFLKYTNNHPRCCILYDPSHLHIQHMDYLQFIDIYHERIKMFHVKDAEFVISGKSGVYGGYQNWIDRPGRFRSLGDGQIDFKGIFSRLAKYGFDGWAVLEWECCLKNSEDGAREGFEFIKKHIIRTPDYAFDNFAKADNDIEIQKQILGLDK